MICSDLGPNVTVVLLAIVAGVVTTLGPRIQAATITRATDKLHSVVDDVIGTTKEAINNGIMKGG